MSRQARGLNKTIFKKLHQLYLRSSVVSSFSGSKRGALTKVDRENLRVVHDYSTREIGRDWFSKCKSFSFRSQHNSVVRIIVITIDDNSILSLAFNLIRVHLFHVKFKKKQTPKKIAILKLNI